MTGINSAVTGKFSDPPVIMTGITSRFISRPGHDACKLNYGKKFYITGSK
jgi:hypothetical protein